MPVHHITGLDSGLALETVPVIEGEWSGGRGACRRDRGRHGYEGDTLPPPRGPWSAETAGALAT